MIIQMEKNKYLNIVYKTILYAIGGILIFLIKFQNNIIFHTFIESSYIIIGLSITIISINTYKFNPNDKFTFLGISYVFVSFFIVLHIFTYINIENIENNYNYSIQLGNIASFFELLTFLIISVFINKKIRLYIITLHYALLAIFIYFIVFYTNILPSSYKLDIGQTDFNILVNYLFVIAYSICFVLLSRRKKLFNKKVLNLVKIAITLKIITYIIFLTFLKVLDIQSNLAHYGKLISIIFIYKAIIEVNLKEPYKLLKTSNEKLAQEIEKRKELENKLENKSIILESILESTADGILVVDEQRKVIHNNKKFQQIWEIPDDIVNIKEDRVLVDFVKEKFENPNDFVSRVENTLNKYNNTFDIYNLNCGRIIEKHSNPLILNDNYSGIVWSFRDITKGEKIISELKIKNEIIETTLNGIYYTDMNGSIIYANESLLKLWGYNSLNEIKNKDSLILWKNTEFILEQRKKDDDLEKWFIQLKGVKKDGTEFDAELFANIIKDDKGIPIYRAGSVIDVSERVKAEELEKDMIIKDELLKKAHEYDILKTQFFSNISHELRTPLNIIYGTVQLLDKKHGLDYENCNHYKSFKGYTKILKQNSFRLLRLINNLIDITRIDTGFLNVKLEDHNIINIIEDITLSVVEYAKSKDITVLFDTEIEEKIIACDPDKIERITLNLLSNAIKFTKPKGSIYVNIFEKEESVHISIKDTGIGIPEDKLNKIFERFDQVDTTLTRKNEGSGIGLSLVKSLVEAHGGNVSVKSSLGIGSEFIVELPCKVFENDNFKNINIYEDDKARLVEKINIEFSDIYEIEGIN